MKRLILLGLLPIVLTACSFGVPIQRDGVVTPPSRGPVQKSERGNPPSYIVMGRQYHVMDSAEGFTQRGVASWYGRKFHGKKTSNGETYNMYAMTAAHKTLPIPTWVRVDNLENGKSIIVRVNDRGPFVKDRIIDLSYTAAQKIDMIGKGTARVEISALRSPGDTSRPAVRAIPLKTAVVDSVDTANSARGQIFLQMGSFSSEINAINLQNQLYDLQKESVRIEPIKTENQQMFRVQVGPLHDLKHAQDLQKRLQQQGMRQARIVVAE